MHNRDWPLASFYFTYLAVLGAFSPYIGPFLKSRGFSGWEIGVVMSVWYGTRIFAPPLWSAAVSRANEPIGWLRGGCIAGTAAFAVLVLPLPFAATLFSIGLFAVFYNAVLPQFEALTMATIAARRSAYGRIRVWGSIGFVIANVGYGWLLQQWGYGWLAWLLLPAQLLMIASAFGNRYPVAAQSASAPTAPAEGFWATIQPRLRRTELRWFLLAGLLMQIAHGPFYVFFSLFLGRHGYSAGAIGGIWAVGVIAEILMFLAMPRVLSRYPAAWVMLACFAAGVVRWLMTAGLTDVLAVVVLAQLLHALTFAAFHSSGMQIIGKHFEGNAAMHGQALLYGFSSGVGGVIGALLAAALWEYVAPGASFVGASVISLLGMLAVRRLLAAHREQATN